MSSDFSVTRAGAASVTADVARPNGDVPVDGRAADPAQVPPTPAGKSLPNPTLRLDPGLAIVVIEFRDKTGTVRSTIPTQQQLDAYRSWDRGHIGEQPPGGRAAADGGAARGATPLAKGSAAAPQPHDFVTGR